MTGTAKKKAKTTRKKKAVSTADTKFTGKDRVYDFADSVVQDAGDKKAEQEKVEEQLETWVSFELAGETFALPVTVAREILRVTTVTRVPHSPYPVRGIINVRGQVVPVVDLRLRIGLPETESTDKSRILTTWSRERLLGLLVDSVEQVVRLDRNKVEAPPADVMTEQSEYISGVYHLDETLLILLDVESVLVIPDSLAQAAQA